ncbi:AAA family ATPase [Inquilinus sp. OTU3971]|uniref:AAA family ATPase n=1 Tax=Inquilinus sp. OTU3971 TaxID=3043855 RepID=UPI00313B0217
MFKFGVANLRRLKETPAIEVKPITLLVGRNSSGKSTFLRSLPLIKQSVKTRTNAPILWYGDYVDFGSFNQSVYCNDTSNDISFTFVLDDLPIEQSHHYTFSRMFGLSPDKIINEIELRYTIAAHESKTRLKSIECRINPAKRIFNLYLSPSGQATHFTMNGNDILDYFSGHRIFVPVGDIFPYVGFAPESIEDRQRPDRELRNIRILQGAGSIIRKSIKRELDPEQIMRVLSIISGDEVKESFRFWSKNITSETKGLAERIRAEANPFDLYRLKDLSYINDIIPTLNSASERLTSVIDRLLYIGPARARSERYYRLQDLAVSEIDADGKNLPMFLNSLDKSQLSDLSEWIFSLYGFKINVSSSEGHISINMIDNNNTINIIDTGYGVSQILPVLAQLWWARTRSQNMYTPTILAIEQPELHLHPAHQSLLADALTESLDASNRPYRRPVYHMIETHSETLINRFGELIYQKRLSPDNLQILIFSDPEDGSRSTDVRVSYFDEFGALQNWPFGFFQH